MQNFLLTIFTSSNPTSPPAIPFRCGDYYGIRLVQQLRGMPDKMKARAEVAVYMHNFDEAEAIYRYALKHEITKTRKY